MKKIILSFCMMLNIAACAMSQEMSYETLIMQNMLEKASKTTIMEIGGKILGNNFELLIKSNDDFDLQEAITQIWDREADHAVDDMIEAAEKMNIYDAIPGYQNFSEFERNEIKAEYRRALEQGKASFKAGFIIEVKTFRHAYAVHKANKVQSKTN